MPEFAPPAHETKRLESVEEILAQGQDVEAEFNRLTRLASRVLRVPTCLISLVTAERQEFKGACGLPDSLEEVRGTPLSHSFCKITVASNELLLVENAREDPRVSSNPVVEAVGLGAYLGFPLMNRSGEVLGSFCLVDYEPRKWTEEEIDLTRDLAGLAVDLIEAAAYSSRIREAYDSVLHDLKSPLSGMLFASNLFKEHSARIPENLHPLVGAIESSSTAAIRLVESLAKKHHGLQAEEQVCPDPAAVVTELCNRIRPVALAKGMTLEVDTAAMGLSPLAVPAWALSRVLQNLLTNAIKFSPPGSTVQVTLTGGEEAATLTVRDEGPGFSEQDLASLYQRYTRLSATPTAGENSTGLGLSIVKRLAEQHGGSVELVSAVGQGAEFRVSFPQMA